MSTRSPGPKATEGGGSGADGLASFRARLDEIDDAIARLVGERFEICRQVARYKSEHEIPMMQPGRVEIVRARYLARGAEVGLPRDFSARLFELLIAATCKLEDELIEQARVERVTCRDDDATCGGAKKVHGA
jgi:chorismate mutase-like protein